MTQAVVLELPVRPRRPTHPCGCYQAAVPEPGRMRWLRYPSNQAGLALFSDEDAREILDRGWIVIDGQRALVRRDRLDCPHWIALAFDNPWKGNHP